MNITHLLQKAIANDQRAFNILFDMHWDYVYGFLIKKSANPQAAEEIALKCFSKAFDKIEDFDPQAKFSSWLIAIAQNLWVDHQRRYYTKKSLLIATMESVPEHSSPHLDPEEAMIANQKWEILLQHIQTLNQVYRQMIQWCYLDGLSYQQIADRTHQPLNTVKVKLFRAKKILAEKLASQQ